MYDIMTYTKERLGQELKTQLLQGKDYIPIANWAFKIYLVVAELIPKMDLGYIIESI